MGSEMCIRDRFKTVSEEDLNKWYEKRDKYELLEKLGGTAY